MAKKKAKKAATRKTRTKLWKRGTVRNLPDGTYRQGEINATVAQLSRQFGAPNVVAGRSDMGASTVYRWVIVFADGTVANVYDYKGNPMYVPEDFDVADDANSVPKKVFDRWKRERQEWSIGGTSKRAATLVLEAMGEAPKHALGELECKVKYPPKARTKGRAVKDEARALGAALRDLVGL